ncbi:hypothetical protein [Secundilactobacillus collinoides]|uniref:hypothetical protein n=1 Tax=Secundilactobacillus collinoides TaxID=33960 RepID=UPI0006CFA6BD|nr:hypothetical protein [Secundilactobacillus collinoides]
MNEKQEGLSWPKKRRRKKSNQQGAATLIFILALFVIGGGLGARYVMDKVFTPQTTQNSSSTTSLSPQQRRQRAFIKQMATPAVKLTMRHIRFCQVSSSPKLSWNPAGASHSYIRKQRIHLA